MICRSFNLTLVFRLVVFGTLTASPGNSHPGEKLAFFSAAPNPGYDCHD